MDAKLSFGHKVVDYAASRPDYPPEVLALVSRWSDAGRGLDIADVGSGTGIFTRQLLQAGHRVYAVEPDARMRTAAESTLSRNCGFISVDGWAERTGLDCGSVDIVTAAQSLHWFDPERSRREFQRILRPHGRVVAIWNERRREGSRIVCALEELLRAMQEDALRDRSLYDASIYSVARTFFSNRPFACERVTHLHRLDREQLIGRVMSSSFAPERGSVRYEHWRSLLDALFASHSKANAVLMVYDTFVVHGALG